MREGALTHAIRAAVNRQPGARFWRNNVGLAHYESGAVPYGLGRGSADLVGLVRGTFTALEVKTLNGRTSAKRAEEQRLWRETVRRFGGVAEVVCSVEEAIAVVQGVSRGR